MRERVVGDEKRKKICVYEFRLLDVGGFFGFLYIYRIFSKSVIWFDLCVKMVIASVL